MISIFGCEDDNLIRSAIEKEIKSHIMIQNYDMEITLCTGNPEELVEHVRENPKRGVYFLDIDLNNSRYDGFELGKEIRKYDSRGFIIYVTSYHDLAFKTFQYHIEALDYIVKSDPDEMLRGIRRCIDTVVKRMKEEAKDEKKEYYTVKVLDTVKHIPVSDIYFFETSGRTHRIILHAENELMDFIGKLQEIEDDLATGFVRTHRSFLVNVDKIKELNMKRNEIVMDNGQVCLMSRQMKPVLIRKIEERSR